MRDHADPMPPSGQRRVRAIGPGDRPDLVDLWRETWTSTYGPTLGDGPLQAMLLGLDRGTTAMLPGRDERGHALVQGQRIIGTAITAERGATVYLWGMDVRPAHQHRGAGSQLLTAIARDLAPSAELESRVLTTSSQALAFYRARGFRVVGKEVTNVIGGVDLPTLVLRVEVAHLRAVLD